MRNKQLIKKIVFLLMASLSLLLVTLTHAAAQQLPFYCDNINVIIDVQTNGDMLVTETQKYVALPNLVCKKVNNFYKNWL
jgi:hypothetical protein